MLLTWGASRGGAGQPSFALGFADLGLGAVDTSTQGVSVTPTFTRATTAWTKLSSGLWASVASGTARSNYYGADTTVGAYGGYLPEGARTNLCLQARDLSDAAWTKVNTTAAKDQTGIDGAANSASSLTCTVGGGTCLQTITEAATTSGLSMFIKRITGTGTVTIQQGASTSDVTALINSATYTRVELDASVLNPAIGITLGTATDKIAVDMVQFENGAFSSSPIPTTSGSVTRNADVLTYPTAAFLNAAAGTMFVQGRVFSADASINKYIFSLSDGTFNEATALGVRTTAVGFLFVADGGVTQANISTLGSVTANTTFKLAGCYATNDFAATIDGGVPQPDTGGTLPTVTTAVIGADPASAQQTFGTISRIAYFPNRLDNSALVAMTA